MEVEAFLVVLQATSGGRLVLCTLRRARAYSKYDGLTVILLSSIYLLPMVDSRYQTLMESNGEFLQIINSSLRWRPLHRILPELRLVSPSIDRSREDPDSPRR